MMFLRASKIQRIVTGRRTLRLTALAKGIRRFTRKQSDTKWKLATLLVGCYASYQTYKEYSAQHDERYIEQVISRLSREFQISQDRVKDIPNLKFVERDEQRMGALKGIFNTPGGLTLLEGPSGCGKTTAIQHALVKSGRPGVYFSVRDNSSGRSPLAAFAQAFGVKDLPQDKWSDSLDIIRIALEKLQARSKNDGKPPVLVIDDVQQLLKPAAADDGGRKILEWCLGRAANQELTVLFISSELVQQSMKSLSGYAARLRVPDVFDYIEPHTLKASLREIEGNLSFTDEEADRVIKVFGTHMSDIRRLQRRRVEENDQPASCDEALEGLLIEEIRLLNTQLSPTTDSLSDQSLARYIVGKTVCDLLAESNKDLSVSELWKATEASFGKNWKLKVTGNDFESITNGLVEKNVLRRYYRPKDSRQYLAFHRPVLRTAYRQLSKSEDFVQEWKSQSATMSSSSVSFYEWLVSGWK